MRASVRRARGLPGRTRAPQGWAAANTRPRRARHDCPSVLGKENHRLALGFRTVLESGLFIPKEIVKSHVQK